MLTLQQAGETTSPMDFSLSVHNATAAQYHIAKDDHSPSTSLSSRSESFTAALLEAQGMLAEGHERILVVMSDLSPPTIFSGRWDQEPSGYALGLILAIDGGEGFDLSLCATDAVADSVLPQALVFMDTLTGTAPSGSWQRGRRRWSWTRL